MPAISVIVPIYNVEKYLRRCLDSLQSQTFQDWEAICVNDGSPDASDKILAEYAARDPRFVVINQKNGGLSDARNTGMKHARGEYILYVDSDDFIHPQTLEIAHTLAVRDGSDIVSFTYDRHYRPTLMVRHILGMDTDGVIPRGMRRRYDVTRIKTRVTDDIFKYATERTHNLFNPRRKWLIKHCQVWKNLYRRDLIADTPFIKGILFEDFPWWSSVMLKNPRVTIAPLPLYFYVPNFGGIVLSAKQMRIMRDLGTGLCAACAEYQKNASPYQMQKWSENFRWYFVNWTFRKARYAQTDEEILSARDVMRRVADCGALNAPMPRRWRDLRTRIMRYLGDEK